MPTIHCSRARPVFFAATIVSVLALPVSGRAQDSIPRYESAKCAFERGDWADDANLECGTLLVREDAGRPDSRVLRLPVAILRARQPSSKPPLVMLHGGPGGSPTQLGAMAGGVALGGGARDRDVVLYDQRGAGLAQPVLCPTFRMEDYEEGGVAARQRFRTSVAACVESIRRNGGDPAMYNTAASVRDLIALRRALGYPVWDVWGESYGGRLAVEAMRADPQGIRSIVLDKPAPHGLYRAEVAKVRRDALRRVFDACAADPTCAAASPSPQQDLHALYDRLNASPVLVDSVDGRGETRLDGAVVVQAVMQLARSRSGIAWIPFLLHELRRGDFTRASRELLSRSAGVGAPARVSFWLVECNDQYGPEFVALQDSIEAGLPELYRVKHPLECDVWLRDTQRAERRGPVTSDIPTLIVTGHFDAVMPPEYGRRIAQTLSRAHVFEIPSESHNGRDATPCHVALLMKFWEDPKSTPDGSCLEALPPIQFVSRWPGVIRSGVLLISRLPALTYEPSRHFSRPQ